MALRARKVSGALEKRAPGDVKRYIPEKKDLCERLLSEYLFSVKKKKKKKKLLFFFFFF